MTSNHKLTALIKGRTVKSATADGAVLTITLDNGSLITVQTGGAVTGPTAGIISAVRQSGTSLEIVYEDKTTLDITLAEETSSVMVRDKDHVMAYAD